MHVLSLSTFLVATQQKKAKRIRLEGQMVAEMDRGTV
jgi:hypothetical protein